MLGSMSVSSFGFHGADSSLKGFCPASLNESTARKRRDQSEKCRAVDVACRKPSSTSTDKPERAVFHQP